MDWGWLLPEIEKPLSEFTAGDWLNLIDTIAWGPFMIVLLVGTGIYLTIRLRGLQLRYLGHSVACISGKYDDPKEAGDISHFQALSAALSATIGVGNIAGVATAIHSGGPGAVFWMWVTALVGMATKYTSCSLAVLYRKIHRDGSASGGPMWYLSMAFPIPWLGKTLAFMFALFAVVASFGIGNMTQANSVVEGSELLLDGGSMSRYHELTDLHADFQTRATTRPELLAAGPVGKDGVPLPPVPDMPEWRLKNVQVAGHPVYLYRLGFGMALAVLVGVVIIGGIRRIAGVASRIVPAMCLIYVAGAVWLLVRNYEYIGSAFGMIFKYAFTPYAAGGGFLGYVVASTIRYGVARGVFSNESGLGSAPMAHAAAKTHEPAREGFVAMLGPFIDTIIVCTMTALVILSTGAHETVLDGAQLTAHAFNQGLPGPGHWIVSFGLIFFAYSTMISWSYYGDRSAEYIFGRRAILPYRILFTVVILFGAVGALQTIWTLADIFNALMAIPNLIALIVLVGVTVRYTRDYTRRLHAGELLPPDR